MALASRAFLSLVSQGLNTAQNLTLALLAARFSRVEDYGAWGIAFAVFVAVQAIARAIISTPQLIRSQDRDRVPLSAASGASAIVSAPVAVTILAVSLALTGPVSHMLTTIAIVMPFALMQDALRYSLIRAGKFQRLVEVDAVWVIVQIGAAVALIYRDGANAGSLTLAWGVGALASSIYGLAMERSSVDVREGWNFLARERRAGALMALESSLGTIAANSVPIVVGIVLSLEDAGYFRGAMTIAGGIGFLVAGLTPIMTLESSRRLRKGAPASKLVAVWSGGLFVASLVYWGGFALLPSAVGSAILGETWVGAHALLLMFGVQSILRGPITGVPIILRARENFEAAIRLRISTSWLQVAGPAIGAVFGGVVGAGWGYAGAAAINSAQSLHRLNGPTKSLRRDR